MSSEKTVITNTIKKYVFSIFIGLLFYLIGVFITSILIYSASADSGIVFYIPYVFIVFGGLISSKYLYKNSNNRGFEVGIKAGIFYSLVLIIISFVFSFKISVFSLLMILVAFLSCVIGGVMAANSRK